MMEKPNILIIDDEKGICDFFQKVLTKEGYKVSTALNGQRGLSIVNTKKPELVLLDLKMKGMDGVEVLRQIKRIDKNIVVIMLTAYGTMETARMAMRLGAFDYLTKPFDLEYVKAVIKDGLRLTLRGVVTEFKKSKAVRGVVQEKTRLDRMRHCHKDKPCLWEVAIRAFILGDDKLAIEWMEDTKVPKEEKMELMRLAQFLKSGMAKGK